MDDAVWLGVPRTQRLVAFAMAPRAWRVKEVMEAHADQPYAEAHEPVSAECAVCAPGSRASCVAWVSQRAAPAMKVAVM